MGIPQNIIQNKKKSEKIWENKQEKKIKSKDSF